MRKFLCIVLAFIIISVYATGVYAEDGDNNLTDLQSQQQDLQNQLNDSNQQLQEVQSQLSDNLQQIEKLDDKIKESEDKISELDEKVEKLENVISEVQKKLDVAEKDYEKQKEIMEKRLVAIYEAGDTQYIDVLLKSSNLSDFLSNCYLITEMASMDKSLLNDVEKEKNEIEDSKQKLEKNQKSLATALENQTKTSTVLQNTKTLRENYISRLSDEEKAKQAQIDEITSQYEAVNSQILDLAKQGLDTAYIGGVLAWPVPGYTKITSNYGMRVHPITGQYKLHTGVDIGAPMGANFVAANDGIVTKAEYNTAYGNMVMIDHGGGISTLYAHGSEILVTVGQTVKRNEAILKVGSTGYSTGAHAHFEVRINGVVTNPIEYITNGVIPETQKKDDDGRFGCRLVIDRADGATDVGAGWGSSGDRGSPDKPGG